MPPHCHIQQDLRSTRTANVAPLCTLLISAHLISLLKDRTHWAFLFAFITALYFDSLSLLGVLCSAAILHVLGVTDLKRMSLQNKVSAEPLRACVKY